MDKVLLPPERVEELLGELCVNLGFCLLGPAYTRIVNAPPRTIDRFTEVVLRADWGDPATVPPKLLRHVREIVAHHFNAERQRQATSSAP